MDYANYSDSGDNTKKFNKQHQLNNRSNNRPNNRFNNNNKHNNNNNNNRYNRFDNKELSDIFIRKYSNNAEKAKEEHIKFGKFIDTCIELGYDNLKDYHKYNNLISKQKSIEDELNKLSKKSTKDNSDEENEENDEEEEEEDNE